MSVVKLTRKLISIPSYLDEKTDEKEIGDFVFAWLKGNCPWLKIEKQPVEKGRFNIFVCDDYPAQLMFCGHLDTVQPTKAWTNNPLEPKIIGDRLYGLGAADMKGGLACILETLKVSKNTKGVRALFYVDEEYDFKGMRSFVKNSPTEKPELVVTAEPTNLKIGNGARGCLEINFWVRGQTGHAARPEKGKNAIIGSVLVVEELKKWLETFEGGKLEKTSCNLAAIKGGLDGDKNPKGGYIIKEQSNAVPDIANLVLDIRPATKALSAERVIRKLESLLEDWNLELIETKTRFDLGVRLTPKKSLKDVESVVGTETGSVEYQDISKTGYSDLQMLEKKWKVPCITLGPGPEESSHKPDEFVSVESLRQTVNIFKSLLTVCRDSRERG